MDGWLYYYMSDNFSFGTLRNDVRGVKLGIVVVFIVYFFLNGTQVLSCVKRFGVPGSGKVQHLSVI